MTGPKSFRVTEIRTAPDGTVFLIGNQGAIAIHRVNAHYSAAHRVFNVTSEESGAHVAQVADILTLGGGLAF